MRLRPARWTSVFVCTTIAAVLGAACSPDLPSSVQEGSAVTVGWSQQVTTLNAATTAGADDGNQQVGMITHDAFARIVDGEVTTDESFGTVEVIDTDVRSFTVRYDLADRAWSDGVPVDAADLMLAWAAESNATSAEFDSVPTELRQSTSVPTVDDFDRRIDVLFEAPVRAWQTALDVAVPAHVVGEMALGVDDPMEAKQAVIDAITSGDAADLAAIAETWNTGFDLDEMTGDVPPDLAVASGPYEVTQVDQSGSDADHIRLEVNREHTGDAAPYYERLDVVPAGSPLDEFPADVDVIQLSPNPDNFLDVRSLERLDHHVATTHDGRIWALVLRADRGVFRTSEARRAFLRAVPRADLKSGGAGAWDNDFSTTQSLLFAPESDGYDVALEDAGFREAFENGATNAAADRAGAGVAAATEVCVLYDTDEPFAVGAFGALRSAVAEDGWKVRDCGRPDVDASVSKKPNWQAVLTTVPLPESPEDITETWGGDQPSPLTGAESAERAQLVAELAKTADPYEARDLQVEIEAELIQGSFALPLSMEPVVTLSDRSLSLVQPESGGSVTLLSGAAGWAPEL